MTRLIDTIMLIAVAVFIGLSVAITSALMARVGAPENLRFVTIVTLALMMVMTATILYTEINRRYR